MYIIIISSSSRSISEKDLGHEELLKVFRV